MKVDVSSANKQVTEDVTVEILNYQLVQKTKEPGPTASDA